MLDHPQSAQNRYIYTKKGLQKLPSSVFSLIRSIHKRPISLIPRAILQDLLSTTEESRTRSIDDESIQEFIARRFGDGIGEELISGMVHGIYAGDYKSLSVRSSLFKPVWELERRYGGVIKGMRTSDKEQHPSDMNEEDKLRKTLDGQLLDDLVNCSVWGLKGGLETLIVALRDWLAKKPNVILKSTESVESIEPSSASPSKVITSLGTYEQIDHLISALPPQVLHSCLSPPLRNRLNNLVVNPSVTVGVVNLAYRSTQRINPIPPAFGYLIPASIGPELNPHRVLGVVFDSDMMPGVEEKRGGEELTKLTVMLGGHYYSKQPDSIPTTDQLIQQASQTIKHQLGISQDPFFVQAQIQKDCIPQYLVGHHQRMRALHRLLHPLNLSLVGSGYSGVGLNDVVKSAKDNVVNLLNNGHSTGLESFDT